MTVNKGYRFILSARDRRVIWVHKNTFDSITAYAKSRDITITEATQRLLSMAIRREYIDDVFNE